MMNLNERRYLFSRYILFFALGIPFVLIFVPFFVPILMATLFALGLEPLWSRAQLKQGGKKYFSLILIGAWFLFIFLPFVFVSLKAVRAIEGLAAGGAKDSQFFQSVFKFWDKTQHSVESVLSRVGVDSSLLPSQEEILNRITPVTVKFATNFLAALPELGLSILIFFAMVFVLVTNGKLIKKSFLSLQLLPDQEVNHIIAALQTGCLNVLSSTLIIGAIQALIVAIGSLIFGFHEFFLIFIITFVLSFIPVIGAAPVAFFLATASFLMGENGSAVGLLVIAIIAGSIDNILKPYIFSSEDEGLNPIVALIGIIGAIVIFGLPGLLLGPLLLQVGMRLLPPLLKRLLHPDEEPSVETPSN